MNIIEKLKSLILKKEDAGEIKTTNSYLSGKEIRKIAKENGKVMKRLEAYKYRKADESEFVTELKDEKNILKLMYIVSMAFCGGYAALTYIFLILYENIVACTAAGGD